MVHSRISFGSLNVRGLKEVVKRKALFLFCKGQKCHCLFLQETHSVDADVTFWTNQWGDKILFSHGSNRSGGVAICFNKFPGEIITYKADSKGHWLTAVLKSEGVFLIVTNLYGHNNEGQNKSLLENLTKVISEFKAMYPTDHILVGGDWNMTPDEWMDRWPPRLGRRQQNDIIENFSSDNNFTDIWRSLNPGVKNYSWFKPNGESRSRIDYWLVSDDILRCTSQCKISKAPLSDHCFIDLVLEPTRMRRSSRGYWKFNASLLNKDKYCDKIRHIITDIKNDDSVVGNIQKWEFIKFKIREFTIKFCKEMHREKREYESNLLREITQCCSKEKLNVQEKNKLMELQTKLDDLYLEKAQGAFIRSRAKWIEAGEKNSSYFSKLEKSRQQRNLITSLLINGTECKDSRKIEGEVFTFYSKLYSSEYSAGDSDSFFDKIHHLIPCIDGSFKDLCDSELKIEELDLVVMKMALNKSPGTDGLTTNFYQFFWKDLRTLLFDALKESIEKKELMPSMKQGLITLIPKSGKDKRILDNLRPITLLNTDYKILSGAVAERLKKGISNIISETQSGFLKGRLIHNNIRLVLDLLEYSEILQERGYILFLDFYKAFDSVEHTFILKTLQSFGFGEGFVNVIEMLYNGINSSVLLEHGTCSRFEVNRGIRQGCSSSPLLFIMVAELLSILIKNSHIEGLTVMGERIIISQLADDTTLFLKDEDQIPLALQVIDHFSKASGLQLNINKCEILALHECPLQVINNIQIKKEVKYLGIVICKDKTSTENKNICTNIEKCKSILNRWLQRDITLFGRILLTKMDSLSRLIYPAFSLPISPKLIKSINNLNFRFIWRNKCHYIKKNDMIKNYEEGGANAIDFDVMNGVLKLKWLRSFIRKKNSFWNIIPNVIFGRMGGIDFLLRCDFDCSSLPVKLSAFHQQALLYWKLIYKHNFTPHNTPIWNNRYIRLCRKSVYMDEWRSKGIWAVAHFLDENGVLLKHETFCEKYDVRCTAKKYKSLIKAIPVPLRSMIKEDIVHSGVSPGLRQLCIAGVEFDDSRFTNKVIRNILINEICPNPVKRNYILKEFESMEVKAIRKKYISLPLSPKVKEVHFKIINEVYPTNEFLRRKFNLDVNACTFCESDIESLDHLFFYCESVHSFWSDMWSWLQSRRIQLPHLTVTVIKFGILADNADFDLLIRTFLLMGKFFIHKCRYFKAKPCINRWQNDFKLWAKSLKLVNNKKAHKLVVLFNEFDLC